MNWVMYALLHLVTWHNLLFQFYSWGPKSYPRSTNVYHKWQSWSLYPAILTPCLMLFPLCIIGSASNFRSGDSLLPWVSFAPPACEPPPQSWSNTYCVGFRVYLIWSNLNGLLARTKYKIANTGARMQISGQRGSCRQIIGNSCCN